MKTYVDDKGYVKISSTNDDEDHVVRIAKSGQSLILPLGWGECTIVNRLTLFKDNNDIFVV